MEPMKRRLLMTKAVRHVTSKTEEALGMEESCRGVHHLYILESRT